MSIQSDIDVFWWNPVTEELTPKLFNDKLPIITHKLLKKEGFRLKVEKFYQKYLWWAKDNIEVYFYKDLFVHYCKPDQLISLVCDLKYNVLYSTNRGWKGLKEELTMSQLAPTERKKRRLKNKMKQYKRNNNSKR